MHWSLGVVLLLSVPVACLWSASRDPSLPGMVEGRLRPCPDTPNCVCSDYEGAAWSIEPIAANGASGLAWNRLKKVIEDAGGTLQKEQDGYLWATFTTRIFHFVDDVECRIDRARRVIHVRSASRVGYSDLGVNRRRVERLRTAFYAKELASAPCPTPGFAPGKRHGLLIILTTI